MPPLIFFHFWVILIIIIKMKGLIILKTFSYKINDPIGIHARPAGLLIKRAGTFRSEITLTKGDKTADAKKIFAVMSLGVKQNDEVTITANGEDEDKAIEALQSFFNENL